LDSDIHLHHASSSWLYAHEHCDGYGRLGAVEPLVPSIIIILNNFYDEQLLAVLFMSRGEKFVTMEALAILTSLGDLSRRKAEDHCRR
jgi:hypothetical protein